MTAKSFDGRWSKFRTGTLPCVACGIAVPAEVEDAEPLEVAAGTLRGSYVGNGHYREFHASRAYPVTRCARCGAARATAAALLGAYPDVRRSIGSPDIALYQAESAFLGLDVIGAAGPHRHTRGQMSRTEFTRLIYSLRQPGAAARWAHHVLTRRGDEVRDAAPNATRWAHLTSAQMRPLHEAHVQLNADKVMKPRGIVPLDENGGETACMLCGVGSWEALPGHARDVWRAMSADSDTLGGRVQPEPIDGVVCPRCDRAIDAAHGVGQSAMRASVLEYLGADFGPRWETTAPDFGLVAWGVLHGRQPNREPWDHIDLNPLRDDVAAAGRPARRDLASLASSAMGRER